MNCNICHNRISKRDARAGVIGSGDARLSRLTHYGKVACGECRKLAVIEMIALGLVPLAQVTGYAGQRQKTAVDRYLRAAAMKFIIGAAEDHRKAARAGRPAAGKFVSGDSVSTLDRCEAECIKEANLMNKRNTWYRVARRCKQGRAV